MQPKRALGTYERDLRLRHVDVDVYSPLYVFVLMSVMRYHVISAMDLVQILSRKL